MSQKGFTLVEIIGVLLIISIVSGVAIVKFGGNLNDSAERVSAEFELTDINRSAKTIWAIHKMNSPEFSDDAVRAIEIASSTKLTPDGASLVINGAHFPVHRTPSTSTTPPEWRKGW